MPVRIANRKDPGAALFAKAFFGRKLGACAGTSGGGAPH